MSISSSKVVSKPISLSELANLFGCRQDVATICTSPRINMWAKYKPFSLYQNDTAYSAAANTQGILFYETQEGTTGGFQRKTTHYGLVQAGTNPLIYWVHNKPRLGKQDPARIEDFWGYNHNAKAPYSVMVRNAGVAAPTALDNTDTVEVFFLKGFTGEKVPDSNADTVDFTVTPNSYTEGELKLSDLDSGTYNHFILVLENISSDGTTKEIKVYNMTADADAPNNKSCSIRLPMTKAGTYNAAVVLDTSGVTDGETPSLSSFLPYPLLAKNNKFKLNLVQHLVWDGSIVSWTSVTVYYSTVTNVTVNGTTFHCKKITKINVQGSASFDSKYDRGFYIYLTYYIGANQNAETGSPIRIVGTANSTVIGNSSGGGISGSVVLKQHTKGSTTTFNEDITPSQDIYVCCADGHEAHSHVAVTARLSGRITESSSSNDVGESSNLYSNIITYNSITK